MRLYFSAGPWRQLIMCATGGRPFFVAGAPQVAPLTERSDWQLGDIAVDKSGLSEEQCSLLGQAWAEVAAMEHASIASFARFVLQLMTMGAPALLIEQSQRALADEIVHARACYGLASAYLGRAVGPDCLSLAGAALDESFEQSVIAAVREGCIGETLAAIEAAELAAHCEEPTTREILRQIAEDEARHAQLAWQFVSWALANGSQELRSAVQQEFERAVNAFELPNAASTTNDEWFASRGIMAPSSRRALQARAMTDVIAPCAAEVLSETQSLTPRRGGACPARSGAGV
ncbi:MAG TPA: ferritin-like domain-containing protein [Polyangiaceae bacterium]|nr:ferritin-like domain-containing protein [Polyangiaceae bacterium]